MKARTMATASAARQPGARPKGVMQIQVRLFAMLRERLGTSVLSLDLPQASTVADLRRELDRRHPKLLAGVSPLLIAVNTEYVQDSHPLQDMDEVAFIPPVSGGARADPKECAP